MVATLVARDTLRRCMLLVEHLHHKRDTVRAT
jgi:hypothetical protein